MKSCYFSKTVPTSYGPYPPLAKPAHRGVVQRHLRIEAPYLPALLAQPDAKFRLLTSHDAGKESTDLLKSRNFEQRIPTTGTRFSNWSIPLHVAQLIVDRGFRIALAAPTAYHRDFVAHFQKWECSDKPAVVQDAIAINKLNETQFRCDLSSFREAFISGACRGESLGRIKQDDGGAGPLGRLDAAVG
jgi:hypothetical protein